MTSPFLLKYAKECSSARGNFETENYIYDENVDMVRLLMKDSSPLAIDTDSVKGPMTKKADIEKGEDNKDKRMWG